MIAGISPVVSFGSTGFMPVEKPYSAGAFLSSIRAMLDESSSRNPPTAAKESQHTGASTAPR